MKHGQLIIRPLEEQQIVATSRLIKQSWQIAYRNILSNDQLTQLDERLWQKSLLTTGRYNLVMTSQNKILGVVSYGKTRSVEDGTGELMAIYVLPNQAGKGIGTHLLKNAEKGLKSLGYSHFVLWVLAQNKPAIKFYEAHGWQYNGKQQKKIILNRKVKLLQYEKIIISDK